MSHHFTLEATTLRISIQQFLAYTSGFPRQTLADTENVRIEHSFTPRQTGVKYKTEMANQWQLHGLSNMCDALNPKNSFTASTWEHNSFLHLELLGLIYDVEIRIVHFLHFEPQELVCGIDRELHGSLHFARGISGTCLRYRRQSTTVFRIEDHKNLSAVAMWEHHGSLRAETRTLQH